MPALDAIAIPAIAPDEFTALELKLLENASRGPATLLIAAHPGRLIALGRYHFYDGPAARSGVGVFRRLTGGRVIGAGDGFMRIALIAASPAALLPARDGAIAPAQVINRHVRGILSALRAAGLNCSYPGRDLVTLARREIASCSFEIAASGALLFEAELAIERGADAAMRDLDLLDPEGTVGCAMRGESDSTSVARELGRAPSFAQIAQGIVEGYGAAPARQLAAAEFHDARRDAGELGAGFLSRRASGGPQVIHSRAPSQLGFFEARFALGSGGTIERAALGGDFIANSAGVARLEQALVGVRRHDRGAIAGVVSDLFADGRSFILGIGSLENLVNLLTAAS